MFGSSKFYSLKKSRQILLETYSWYKKKSSTLPLATQAEMRSDLQALEIALQKKERETASDIAKKWETFNKEHFKKSFLGSISELFIALVLALVVAVVVRQMWFELYEIPSGSMRPTFFEQDHLTVSKLAFGINVPLETKQFYFDPRLVQRMGIFIFSGDNIPYMDQDTLYFGILPYKKRYIKRCMGKPGDTLYFYGGQLYGMDKEGNFIKELLDNPWLKRLDHVPFLNFEGVVTSPKPGQIVFRQMNLPLGRLTLSPTGSLIGEVFTGKEWVKDQPQGHAHSQIQTYGDFWGFKNYGIARLLTEEELSNSPHKDLKGQGVLYLEIQHNPSLSYPKPLLKEESRGWSLSMQPFTSVIPLQQKQLDTLMDNMYTSRFVVRDGQAQQYHAEGSSFLPTTGHFADIPNGTYDIYFGKAYQIGWGGIPYLLPKENPLYSRSPENVRRLFNQGIEFDAKELNRFPRRYAYFRNGDLFVLGAPFLSKEDPLLIAFNEKEKQKEQISSSDQPYLAFKDHGPPLTKEGEIDKKFLETFGFRIPEQSYYALGDNYANSSDSRVFGFVPQQNVQGAPSLIIWPPGDRLGPPNQKPYPIINVPRLIVWGSVLAIAAIWYAIHLYRRRQPLKF